MSAASARLDGLVELGIQPRRAVAAARKRAAGSPRSAEALLLEQGRIELADVLAVARRDWLTGGVAGRSDSRPEVHELLEEALTPAEAERLRRALARAASISSTAAATAATVVAMELAVTLAWQEPLSHLTAERAQAALERELDSKLENAPSAPLPSTFPVVGDDQDRERRQQARLELERRSRGYERKLGPGDAVGALEIPALGSKLTVVEGAGSEELALGPGRIRATALPGQGRTTAIAGHRTTYGAPFGEIDELKAGDEIRIELPYGSFTYVVERGAVVDPDDFWVTRDIGRERLVLTTCHPEFSAAERLVIFARLER